MNVLSWQMRDLQCFFLFFFFLFSLLLHVLDLVCEPRVPCVFPPVFREVTLTVVALKIQNSLYKILYKFTNYCINSITFKSV